MVAKRSSPNQQIWVVGCSYAHGIGVNADQRYGQIISEELNLPVSFLTQGGTSNDWAADQILRSDIQSNDIVVWGLTGASRFEYSDQSDRLHNVRLENFDQIPDLSNFVNKKLLISNHMIYNTIKSVEQVRNYLSKLSCRLVLAVFPTNIKEHDLQILDYTSRLKDAIILFDTNEYTFIDYGTDNSHPGPNQHKWYANTILKHLENYETRI